ncbi:hypothetical protein Acsp02_74870 [Actinoplanes sp. NBRC 103695]|nr:hypothetical protein Acsp02_74870 [Actinoplanes sp. NBRC 103695]
MAGTLIAGAAAPASAAVDHVADDAGPRVTVDGGTVVYRWPGLAYLWAELDDQSSLGRIEWWVDGALRSTERDLSYDFGATVRRIPVEVRAWDTWGNASVTTIQVQLDHTAPVVTKVTPNFRQLVRGTRMTSTLTATDPAGFMYAELEDTKVGEGTPGPTATFTASTRLGRDGQYMFFWHVMDRVGNSMTFPRTVIVDNTRPTITKITAPAANAKVGSQVKTSMSATDLNGVKEVQMWVNGRLTLSDSKAPYTMALSTPKYGRSFTVAFYAVDKAGNTISTSRRTWRR